MNELQRNVLVTGGGGFLGKAIVRKLTVRGDKVTSFSRSHYPELEEMNIDQIQGDLGDQTAVTKACIGMDLVYHVAAKAGIWGSYKDYYHTNVVGTQHVINACLDQNVAHLVYTGSPSVIHGADGSVEGVDESAPYPTTFQTHYQKTKALAEQVVVKASSRGLQTIILRPHLIWGPGDNHLVPRILDRAAKLMIVGDGKNLVDTIYIDNAADAHLLAGDALKAGADLSGNIYFISQDEPVYLWEMINAILKAGGKQQVSRSISAKTAYMVGAVLEFAYNLFRIKSEPKMTRFVAHELSSSHWFDISAVKRDLGYKPRVSIEQGLVELKKWLNPY